MDTRQYPMGDVVESTRVARQLPRTKYTHLTTRELLKYTEFEQASQELIEEYRARLAAGSGT